MSHATRTSKIPKLIVFDLDYTLWPFWVDTHVNPPFRTEPSGVVDAHGKKVKFYPEVPKMLEHLRSHGYKLGVASRTSEIEGAKSLLDLFGWTSYFEYLEIYPGMKTTHFNRFKQRSGIDYEDMLFFDDENRNIIDVTKLGATSILVEGGMNMAVLEEGLRRFATKAK